jgi:hypothetical protein
MDMVWLMGMWQRSAFSAERARTEQAVAEACARALPDLVPEDIVGSPYAVASYVPDGHFGTPDDLLALKRILEREGLGLILDFVPNHTACDHPWTSLHPERYVHLKDEGGPCPEGFFPREGVKGRYYIAHGRDPFFPPWTDTAQLNYLCADTITAALETLSGTARFCHGLRCDMAMLTLKEVFRETWKGYAHDAEALPELWGAARASLNGSGQPFWLMAEAYWGKEEILLRKGFDCAYDKGFYDLLGKGDVAGLRRHLSAPLSQQGKLVRFIENHDEPRAASVFMPERIRSAMVAHATVPGIRFWHHGQFEGNRVRVPVQLRRAPEEPADLGLQVFSRKLLREIDHPVFHGGTWEMCGTSGWPDNQTHLGFLPWTWRLGEERRLVVINFTPAPAQGCISFPQGWLPQGGEVVLRDTLKHDTFVRRTLEMEGAGLYVALGPWDFHFFRMERS